MLTKITFGFLLVGKCVNLEHNGSLRHNRNAGNIKALILKKMFKNRKTSKRGKH